MKSFLLAMLALGIASAAPAFAQGMISAPAELGEYGDGDLAAMASATPQQVATIQRLLRRLDLLTDAQMSRTFDEETAAGLAKHFANQGQSARGQSVEQIMRSLFTDAWVKEDWGSGAVGHQSLVTDKAEIKAAQEMLQRLNYAPGPVDGVFGPATYVAIELFQEDSGMNVTGLLTRNVQQNIMLAASFGTQPPKGVVRVLNWPDYVNPEELASYQKETGYRIVHEVFESSTETKELLQQGSDRYDMMIQAGAQMRQVLGKADSVDALDGSKLANLSELDPATLKFTDVLDPGNGHSVPYMWGTVGLGVNKTKVRAIRPDAPLDSLGLIMDPAIAADLSKCGIGIVDEPIDALPALSAYLGADMTNLGITDLEALDQALGKIAPYVTVVSSEAFINGLAEGRYCVAWGYSGDVAVARGMAKEKGAGTIVYSVPKEGSHLWFDLMVVPTKARNKDGAYKLIDHFLKPEVAAANTNFVQYANPVTASAQFIDPALLKDPGLYPPKSVWKRLHVLPPLPTDVEAELTRIWSHLKKE